MPPKRKAAQIDDSDSDEPSFGRQILPVARLPDSFEGEPIDGLQYLFTVRREFNRLPHVTRVANPYEMPPGALPLALPAPPRSSKLPSPEWRATLEQRFKNFRQNIASSFSTGSDALNTTRKLLPDKKDREKWWLFLQGTSESVWNPPKRPKVDRDRRRQHGRDRASAADQLLGPWMPVDSPLPSVVGEPATGMDTTQDSLGDSLHNHSEHVHTQHLGVPRGAFAAPESYSIPMTFSSMPVPPEVASLNNGLALYSSVLKPPEPTPKLLFLVDSASSALLPVDRSLTTTQRHAVHLLMYFAHWTELHLEHLGETGKDAPPTPSPHPITDTHLRWMFALMSRVEDTPTADEMAHLRSLARNCVGLVKSYQVRDGKMPENLSVSPGGSLQPSSSFVGGCWMVFAAVAGVWSQRDLWEEAEEILGS